MTRSEWFQLPETQRHAIRQASAAQSLVGFEAPPRHRQSDAERTMDLWAARDAYRVQNTALGLLLLALVGSVSAVAGMFLR